MTGWCDNYLAAAGVKPGERVRIAVDEPFASEAEALAEAARALGAEARVACFPSQRPMIEATPELMDTAAWAVSRERASSASAARPGQTSSFA